MTSQTIAVVRVKAHCCSLIESRDNVIVRVANEDRLLNPKEDYFCVKMDEKAVQLDEAGTYGAVPYIIGPHGIHCVNPFL